MKIKMNTKPKKILITVLAILFMVLSFMVYQEKQVEVVEKEKTVYAFSQQGNIKYKVNLVPNSLYEQKSLGEGETYITKFIDSFDLLFTYQFSAEDVKQMKGTYEVLGIVEGKMAGEEKDANLWNKVYEIQPATPFDFTKNTYSLEQKLKLNLDEYSRFANKIVQESGVSTKSNLKLIWRVKVEGETPEGPITGVVEPSMIIPLGNPYFKVGGSLEEEKPGEINETVKVDKPANDKKVMLLLIINAIVTVSMLVLIFFTKGYAENDPVKKELKDIFKKHGTRLVEIEEDALSQVEINIKVKTFDDLVKYADELGQPIMYVGTRTTNTFYVKHEGKVAGYSLPNKGGQKELKSILLGESRRVSI